MYKERVSLHELFWRIKVLLAPGADIAFPNMHPRVDAVRMEVLTSATFAATADYAALVRATVVKQGVQAVCIVLTS